MLTNPIPGPRTAIRARKICPSRQSTVPQVLGPGERVVVAAGVYRECVRPLRGGTDPEHMISYEAAPGAKVIIKGSELLRVKWVTSLPWIQDKIAEERDSTAKRAAAAKSEANVNKVWMARLPPELFVGYNPFATANYRQAAQMPYLNLREVFGDSRASIYLQVCGLLFQNGRHLVQASRYGDLFAKEGQFWVETNGLTIHVRPYGGIDPNGAEWEATTREQIVAPETYDLGYIRVKGFTMQHAGNSFPFPQRGALSTMHGHHWLIEDNIIEWANGEGIDIGDGGVTWVGPKQINGVDLPAAIPVPQLQSGPQSLPSTPPGIHGYHILRRNTLNDIGITGIAGLGPNDSLIEDNVFRRNALHDVEQLAECSAIKTHRSHNVLIRRNLIFDTLHGTGIWIDTGNFNSRVCQNVIVRTGSNYKGQPFPGAGSIYVEAVLAPNMVDHNFVWGSTYSNGIFAYTASKLIVAYNLIGNCAEAGITIRDVAGRTVDNRRTIPGGGNRIFGNVLINNGREIDLYSPGNFSDYNLFGQVRQAKPFHLLARKEEGELSDWRKAYGLDVHSSQTDIRAEFSADTLELTWAARGDLIEGMPTDGIQYDFWGRSLTGRIAFPGPFGSVPRKATRIIVDPRVPGNIGRGN